MTDWDYAQLSYIAKKSGGPRALITNIRNGGIATGRWQGSIVGSAVTLAIGGMGLYLYNRHQKKLALANESAEILESNIEVYDAIQAEGATGAADEDEQSIRDEGLGVEAAV